jgi:hypothetical protein
MKLTACHEKAGCGEITQPKAAYRLEHRLFFDSLHQC